MSAPGSGYDKPETILLHSAEEVETLLDVGPAAVAKRAQKLHALV